MSALLTPRQVAESLGVSESSLKRWCDRGDLPATKTPGGHRRVPLSGVLRFLRAGAHQLVNPEAIGLPQHMGTRRLSEGEQASAFSDAIVRGQTAAAKHVVLDAYVKGKSLASILDQIVAVSMRRVGSEWESGNVEIYQEHRACEAVQQVIRHLPEFVGMPSRSAPLAIGAASAGDIYCLPTLMIEAIFLDLGWRATSFGCNLPLSDLSKAAAELQPRCVWVSASDLVDPDEFVADYRRFYEQLPSQTSVVVGGRALTAEIRERIKFASYCDNLGQLVEFADALRPDGNASAAAT